jgi:hypothetical protein
MASLAGRTAAAMIEGKVIMGAPVGRRYPGVCVVAIAAFGPEISGMEFRIDVAFRTCG